MLLSLFLIGSAAGRQPAPATDLLTGTDTLSLTLAAPMKELFAKDADPDFSVEGTVAYKDPSSDAAVKRPATISIRGNTSRRETECTFPKLKLKFKGGDVLKIGTHCGESAGPALTTKYGRLANELSPQREALVYALLRAAEVPTLRTRAATVTYVEDGQAPLTRKALLLEDDDDAKKRVGGKSEIQLETFGNVRTRGASADAGRIALGEAMVGNFDWCLKFSPDDIYRCDEAKPLWNVVAFERGSGAALIAKDFDLAAIVTGPHRWFAKVFNPAFVPSRSQTEVEVLSQVQRTRSLFSRAEIDGLRRGFMERKAAVYAALDSADVDQPGRQGARAYLDAFFKAIGEDQEFYRPVVARADVQVYLDATGTREACGPKDVMRPGTPVNALKREGTMSQVIVLDALWRWTGEKRCESVQTGPVWIRSDAVTREYPSKN
ncbi:MAG: hypothetical protein ABIQ52_14295 [Vicinamibacterales bacterium]